MICFTSPWQKHFGPSPLGSVRGFLGPPVLPLPIPDPMGTGWGVASCAADLLTPPGHITCLPGLSGSIFLQEQGKPLWRGEDGESHLFAQHHSWFSAWPVWVPAGDGRPQTGGARSYPGVFRVLSFQQMFVDLNICAGCDDQGAFGSKTEEMGGVQPSVPPPSRCGAALGRGWQWVGGAGCSPGSG